MARTKANRAANKPAPLTDEEKARQVLERYYRSGKVSFDLRAIADRARNLATILESRCPIAGEPYAPSTWTREVAPIKGWRSRFLLEVEQAAEQLRLALNPARNVSVFALMPAQYPKHIEAVDTRPCNEGTPLLLLWHTLHSEILGPMAHSKATETWASLPTIDRRTIKALEQAAKELEAFAPVKMPAVTDTPADTPKKSKKPRRPDKHAIDCAKLYRDEKSIDPEITLKSAVESYVAEHRGVSKTGLYKRLLDNPNLHE